MTAPNESSAASAHAHPSDRSYVVIWAILLAALGGSLALGMLGHVTAAIVAIFAVAVVKAALVLFRFMHLRDEPRWVRRIVWGALAVVVVLWVGLVPDIVLVYGGIP
jgi:caa(3)-type oxidase subunit IV